MPKKLPFVSPLFLATVFVPSIIAALYFGLFANDIYVSESRIMVRSPTKTSSSPLSAALSNSAITGSSEEVAAVQEYLVSRDALLSINEDGFVRRAYGNGAIFLFDRFGGIGGSSFEQMYRYFGKKTTVEEGDSPLVLRLTVKAYRPSDAREINRRLLLASERLVNELSERAQVDAIGLSIEEVNTARENARTANLALARFRDQQKVIDPEMQAKVGLQMVSQLQEELIASKTRLLQMQTYTPRAPQIPFLKTQIKELEREIAKQTSNLAGGSSSLSANTARFQELTLASQFAEKQLGIALASLQEAQAEARRKQAYIERISEPSMPDYAVYPRRWRGFLATLIVGLLAWGVLSMLIVGIREHRN